MRKLIWKEWHEQSWKLAFCCLVLSAAAFIGLRARIIADDTMMMSVCFVGLSLLPVLSSAGLLPAERSEGSFESLLSLPVAPWKILVAKTAIGVLLCVGPMIASACSSIAIAGGREMSVQAIIELYGRSTLATVSLFFWMLALTSRLPNETRAALLPVGVFIFWILGTAGLTAPGVPVVLSAFSPLSVIAGFSRGFAHSLGFLSQVWAQVVIAALLWCWTNKFLGNSVEDRT